MCDSTVKTYIEGACYKFVMDGKPFTALDVTKQLNDFYSLSVKHYEVKNDIHRCMKDNFPEYPRKLADYVGTNGVAPWVYATCTQDATVVAWGPLYLTKDNRLTLPIKAVKQVANIGEQISIFFCQVNNQNQLELQVCKNPTNVSVDGRGTVRLNKKQLSLLTNQFRGVCSSPASFGLYIDRGSKSLIVRVN